MSIIYNQTSNLNASKDNQQQNIHKKSSSYLESKGNVNLTLTLTKMRKKSPLLVKEVLTKFTTNLKFTHFLRQLQKVYEN